MNEIETKAAQFPAETSPAGAFVRQPYTFRGRITADGSSGFRAEAGRYHLYVSLACPWAHRAIIVRALLGLEDVISLSVVDPIRDQRGWAFREGPGHGADPVNGFAFLSEAYLVTDPTYEGRYTVPCLWDRQSRRLVTNNYPDITIDFETQFTAFHRPGAPDLYPEPLRAEIDQINALDYEDVNNGAYKAGFAATKEAVRTDTLLYGGWACITVGSRSEEGTYEDALYGGSESDRRADGPRAVVHRQPVG